MTWTASNSEGYASPAALAVDAAVFTVRNGALCVLAVDRPGAPPALPGTFVTADQGPLAAAHRALREKTGVAEPYLEQLGAFAEPGRDPRGWIPAIAYVALVAPESPVTDPDARWADARGSAAWSYDHAAIVTAAIERIEGKLWWSNVAVGVLPGAFALSEARAVYSAITGVDYDPATFARDLKATGLIEPTGEQRAIGPGRPAALYRYRSHEAEWGAGHRKRVA